MIDLSMNSLRCTTRPLSKFYKNVIYSCNLWRSPYFHILGLGVTSVNEKNGVCLFLWLELVNILMCIQIYIKTFRMVENLWRVPYCMCLASVLPCSTKRGTWQVKWPELLVGIDLCAKNYQNISNRSRVNTICANLQRAVNKLST